MKSSYARRLMTVLLAFGFGLGIAYFVLNQMLPEKASSKMPLGAADQWPEWRVASTKNPGEMVTFESLVKNRESLLFFGFTHCPDICPTALADISRVLEDLPESIRSTRQVIFVTLDPARDTLDVMDAYTAFFGREVMGVRVEEPLLSTMTRAFGVYFQQTPLAAEGSYTVDHSATLFRITATGQVRVLTAYQEPGALQAFIETP